MHSATQVAILQCKMASVSPFCTCSSGELTEDICKVGLDGADTSADPNAIGEFIGAFEGTGNESLTLQMSWVVLEQDKKICMAKKIVRLHHKFFIRRQYV